MLYSATYCDLPSATNNKHTHNADELKRYPRTWIAQGRKTSNSSLLPGGYTENHCMNIRPRYN